MESVDDVKEALSARSRTATLDQLASEGRKRVRLIRAEHVAAMITEAVHKAIEQSGQVSQEEVDRLVEQSRQEFRGIFQQREQEAERAHALADDLASEQRRVEDLTERLANESARARELREQLAEREAELEALRSELESARAEPRQAAAAAPARDHAAMASPEVLAMLMNEIATLKAAQQARGPAQSAPAADLTQALDKLAGTLNDRLEQFGRKMGISSAVEAGAVNFEGLFKDQGPALESNMDNIQVKEKAGGGIAANLARLKRLKGGG